MKTRSEHATVQNRTGVILIVVGFLLAGIFGYFDAREIALPFAARFVSMGIICGGALLFWRSRQHRAKVDAEAILADDKPDVLYLRAFETDSSVFKYVGWAFLLPRLISGLITEEEQLRDVVQPFGDLVAIGRPGENLPTPGAARLYVSNAQWQSVVSDQMRSAALVIIRAGYSTGLLWELKQAFAMLDPTKVLILVLRMKPKFYKRFREEASKTLGTVFPHANQFRRFGRVSGFVRFSSNWTPSVLRLHAPFLRRTVYRPYQAFFQYSLRPVFADFDLEWQAPPISVVSLVVKLIYAGLALLLFFAALIAIDSVFSLHWFDDP